MGLADIANTAAEDSRLKTIADQYLSEAKAVFDTAGFGAIKSILLQSGFEFSTQERSYTQPIKHGYTHERISASYDVAFTKGALKFVICSEMSNYKIDVSKTPVSWDNVEDPKAELVFERSDKTYISLGSMFSGGDRYTNRCSVENLDQIYPQLQSFVMDNLPKIVEAIPQSQSAQKPSVFKRALELVSAPH